MIQGVRRASRWSIVAAGLLASVPAWAQTDVIPTQTPNPDLVKKLPAGAKTFTLAVALGSPPDDFRNAQGEVAGWEIDIMRGATQLLGLDLDIRPTTFDTLIPGLQAKRFDGATGQMGLSDAREKVVDMIGTLTGNELFAALSDSTIKINGLEDLCGLTVGTTRGSREMVFAGEQNPKCEAAGRKPINALAFNDGNGAAEAVMSRRADMVWLGSTAISYFVAQSKGRTKVVGAYTDPSYIGPALTKGSDLAVPLQAAIQTLIDNGTYGKIVAKWGLSDNAIKTAPLNPTGTPK
ncbi:ABC transporter substrate-binding protein [Acidisphaera sp. L21]|uniref:ABC transporter substrate-binding protein n=1 Tax=Acidisphaera sp. L21 TaxID=1641851 RepID=UPI00131B108C|nr:ABC transporter substrate-binding protein [Acidisphaera sp. L21]